MVGEKEILFVTNTRIGDAVLSTGLLSYLLERHSNATITVACGVPSMPLFECVPNLNRLLVMKKKRLKLHWIELWAKCLGPRWDTIVDLRGSGLAWFLPAGERHMKRVRDSSMHRVEELAGVLGLDDPPAPKIWSAPRHEEEAVRLIPKGGPVLILGPMANWAAKEWKIERFISLVRTLTATEGLFPGARIAVLGAHSERTRACPMFNALPSDQLIDLFGLGLLASYECIRRCAMFIGNDSGLMHLSAASGVPTLGLFGPTQDRHYRPWGGHTAFVRTQESYDELVLAPNFDHRQTGTLMDGLSVDAVANAADGLWRQTGHPPERFT